MTIIYEENDSNWPDEFNLSDHEVDEILNFEESGLHALEYGPAEVAVRSFTWLVDRWTRLAGPCHDRTMVQRAFLARALFLDGDTEAAIGEYKCLIIDRTEVFGAEDPQVLRTRGQLGQIYARGGFPAEAVKIQLELFKDRQRIYGDYELPTLDTMGNLAEALLIAGEFEHSKLVYSSLLKRRTRKLGKNHDDTIRTYLNHAIASARASKTHEEAISILHEAVEYLESEAGPIDNSTLFARGHLANAYEANGDYVTALAILMALVEDREALLGFYHYDTQRTLSSIMRIQEIMNSM